MLELDGEVVEQRGSPWCMVHARQVQGRLYAGPIASRTADAKQQWEMLVAAGRNRIIEATKLQRDFEQQNDEHEQERTELREAIA